MYSFSTQLKIPFDAAVAKVTEALKQECNVIVREPPGNLRSGHGTQHESDRNGGMKSRANIALAVFLTIGAVFLVTEHRAHLAGWIPYWPYLLLLACPLALMSRREPLLAKNSMCEHHMLPFFGRRHIGYIPSGRVFGVSKLARLVDMYARRLQLQERLTEQISRVVMESVDAKGVGVMIEARHLCMMMRGVEKQNSTMITSSVLGVFRDSVPTREEFLSLIGRRAA